MSCRLRNLGVAKRRKPLVVYSKYMYARNFAGFRSNGESPWRAFDCPTQMIRNVLAGVSEDPLPWTPALLRGRIMCATFAGVRGGDERDVGLGDGALRGGNSRVSRCSQVKQNICMSFLVSRCLAYSPVEIVCQTP